MNEAMQLIPDSYVLVEDQEIKCLGTGICPEEYDTYLDGEHGILMPGMVNTHAHVSMIPFRSMGDDCPDRLRRFLFPLELEAMTPELVYAAARYGICEMLLAGITTFADMYYFEDQVAKACEELGMRGYLGETVIQMATCDSPDPYGGLIYGEKFLQEWKDHPLIMPMIAPHATNTNSPEALQKAQQLAQKYEVPWMLHVSEMDYELDYFRETYDQTPTEFLSAHGLLDDRMIAVHCIHMTEHDLELMAEAGVKVSHCIGSNTKAGKGVAPVKAMQNHRIPVGLGTDGPSSGNTLDLFTQFRLFASFQKTYYHDRSLFPAQEIVRLGTMGGAAVLGAESRIGSIEPGKKADLVLVETQSVMMFPSYNPYSLLVYSANASLVDTVMINGRLLVRHKKLLFTDLSAEREALQRQMGGFFEKAQAYQDLL
ncbi:MAG: amidohydrolase [Hungatella sp.]